MGYIDDDTRIEIYHRQIAPLLEDLNSRYEDTSSKTVADTIHEFTETHYSEDVENIFRVHKTIDNIDTNIINSLDNLDVSDEKLLFRNLSSVQDILHTHYMNIVNDGDDVIFIAPLQEIQRCLNNIICKLDPYSLIKQTVLNLNIICSLLLSVEKGDSKLQYFKPIIDKAFIYTKIGFT